MIQFRMRYFIKLLIVTIVAFTCLYAKPADSEAQKTDSAIDDTRCNWQYKFPEGCAKGKCGYHVNFCYEPEEDTIKFSLTVARGRGHWTGIGFAKERTFKDVDFVFLWIDEDKNDAVIMEAFMPNHSYIHGDEYELSSTNHHAQLDEITGVITHQFRRKRVVRNSRDSFNLDECFHAVYPIDPGFVDHSNNLPFLDEQSWYYVSKARFCLNNCPGSPVYLQNTIASNSSLAGPETKATEADSLNHKTDTNVEASGPTTPQTPRSMDYFDPSIKIVLLTTFTVAEILFVILIIYACYLGHEWRKRVYQQRKALKLGLMTTYMKELDSLRYLREHSTLSSPTVGYDSRNQYCNLSDRLYERHFLSLIPKGSTLNISKSRFPPNMNSFGSQQRLGWITSSQNYHELIVEPHSMNFTDYGGLQAISNQPHEENGFSWPYRRGEYEIDTPENYFLHYQNQLSDLDSCDEDSLKIVVSSLTRPPNSLSGSLDSN